jgi:hypothetical protein
VVALNRNHLFLSPSEDLLMKRLVGLGLMLLAVCCQAEEPEKNVPWRAQAEIARRGAMVERVDGYQDASDPVAAISAALQPPADDSHKWLFTLVTMKNCQACMQLRADFENDAKLKAWVDTKDYTKSWAHWHVVQSEDQSQAWRWKDFKPTAFPALIVQPPVNGSWGDPHTIVYVRQGYLKPAELDAAIRSAIQLYAAKTFPRHMAWQAKEGAETIGVGDAGFQQGGALGQGGWNPPVAPPSPLPPVPNYPNYPTYPSYPSVVPEYPPQQPGGGGLLSQLLAGLLGGQGTGNFLLIAILGWQMYRGFAKTKGVPLLLDDATAAQLIQLLQSLRQPYPQQPLPSIRPVSPG